MNAQRPYTDDLPADPISGLQRARKIAQHWANASLRRVYLLPASGRGLLHCYYLTFAPAPQARHWADPELWEEEESRKWGADRHGA